MGSLWVRAVLGWCSILAVAIVSGGVREKIVRPRVGSFGAELFGAVTLSAACFVAAWFVMRAAGPHGETAAMRVGAAWLLATIAFEFGFFHYVGGHPWSELLAAYRFWEGRLWVVVLMSTAASPFAAMWLRTRV